MGVSVQRKACRVVAQHGGHRFYVHAVLERHGREGMTEIVESDAGQPCPFQHPLEHMQDAVWGHGASGGRWEYPLAVSDFALLLFQNAYRVCRQRQRAVGVFRFQRGFDHLAILPRNCPLDFQYAMVEVNVRPL